MPMNIGQAAQAAGVSAKMVRHYEHIGLLPPAQRSDAGYRLYGERDVAVLRFIRQSRRLGFSIPQIALLIGQWGNTQRSSREVKDIALQHLADLDTRLRELLEMKSTLEQLVADCAGNEHAHCAILNGLAQSSTAAPALPPSRAPSSRRRALTPGS